MMGSGVRISLAAPFPNAIKELYSKLLPYSSNRVGPMPNRYPYGVRSRFRRNVPGDLHRAGKADGASIRPSFGEFSDLRSKHMHLAQVRGPPMHDSAHGSSKYLSPFGCDPGASWCSIILGKGRRSRFLRCAPLRGAFGTTPVHCRCSFVHV